jgi:hypothetical protein
MQEILEASNIHLQVLVQGVDLLIVAFLCLALIDVQVQLPQSFISINDPRFELSHFYDNRRCSLSIGQKVLLRVKLQLLLLELEELLPFLIKLVEFLVNLIY